MCVCVSCMLHAVQVCVATEIKLKPLQVAISDAARKCLKLAECVCVACNDNKL